MLEGGSQPGRVNSWGLLVSTAEGVVVDARKQKSLFPKGSQEPHPQREPAQRPEMLQTPEQAEANDTGTLGSFE